MLSRVLRPALLMLFCAGVSLDAAAASKHHHRTSHKIISGPALVIRGDLATSRALVNDIAAAYEDAGRGRIEVQPFNTISGIDATLNGSADLAASGRAGFAGRAQEAGLTFTPVAWDALVIITSPDNPVGNITLKQLRDVYYGDITNWQQLGGRDEPIDLYAVASPLDGSEYSLRRLLYGIGDARVAAPRLYINVGTLEEGVALDPKAMGLSTLSGVHDNRQVKIIPVEGVTPTPASVADGSYPLYTAMYLASNPAGPHAVETAKFMDFLNTEQAKKLMRAHDLLPYGDAPGLSAHSPDDQAAAVTARMVSEGLAPTQAVTRIPPPMPVGAQPQQADVARQTTLPQTAATAPPAVVGTGKSTGDAPAAAAPAASAASGVASSNRTATASAGSPALKKAEATAPSNPVLISAGGTVTPLAPTATTSVGGSYTVAKGDTLSSIARRHSVSVSDLRKWNDLKGDDLRVGQVLKLAGPQ